MVRNSGKITECKCCNKSFYVPYNRIHSAKYCSRKCQGLQLRSRGTRHCEICNQQFDFIETRAKKAKYCSRKCYYKSLINKGTVKFNCQHCGIEFLDSPSKQRKYCSKKCVNKTVKEQFKPKYSTVRKMMLARDMLKSCIRCGYKDHPEILGVHHIDRNNKNNNIENLEVLCPNCHSIEHNKHIVH